MSTSPSDRNLFKDALVFVPLAGTAFAVSYEVGSFLPLGRSFGLFSLSEHLLFAFEPVPVALVAAIILFVGIAGTSEDPVWRRPRRRVKNMGRKLRVRIRLAVWSFISFGLAVLVLGVFQRSATAVAVGICLLVIAMGVASPRRVLLKKEISVPAAVCLVLLITMAMGADTTRRNLDQSRPADFIIDGKMKNAVYVRSGERGLLTYDPLLNEFSFDKWDEVKKISWTRGSLVGQLFCSVFGVLSCPPPADQIIPNVAPKTP